MMKIGVDARALIGPRTGIGRFVEEVVRALGASYPEHRVLLYAPRPVSFTPDSPNVSMRIAPGNRLPGAIWLQTHLPWLARQDRLDVFWGTMFHLPMVLPGVPAVVTVHDLVYQFFPHTMTGQNYLLMKALLRLSVWRAHHVTVDSHAVANELGRVMRGAGHKVTVVYPGISPVFHRRDPEEARRTVARAFGLDTPYVLTVATREPRKNLQTLIRAFALLPAAVRRTHPLVVAGGEGWKNSSLAAIAEPFVRDGSVRFLGYVADEYLPWIYDAAALFLFPSLYEGFGIPVAEAMASGLPTIVSDIPVMREVAGGAAWFVAPGDQAAWSRVILRALEDQRCREAMRDAGLARATEFHPQRSARSLMTILGRYHLLQDPQSR